MLYTLIDYTCVLGTIIYNTVTHVAYYGTAFVLNGFSNDSNYINYQYQIDDLQERIRELEEIENNKVQYIILEKRYTTNDEITIYPKINKPQIALLNHIELTQINSTQSNF